MESATILTPPESKSNFKSESKTDKSKVIQMNKLNTKYSRYD